MTVRVDTRDSASGAYTGPRKESGAQRTVLGLSRARIRLTIHDGSATGPVRFTQTRTALDTGIPGNGDGHLTTTWKAPRPGRYTIVASQTGSSYAPVSSRTTITVR